MFSVDASSLLKLSSVVWRTRLCSRSNTEILLPSCSWSDQRHLSVVIILWGKHCSLVEERGSRDYCSVVVYSRQFVTDVPATCAPSPERSESSCVFLPLWFRYCSLGNFLAAYLAILKLERLIRIREESRCHCAKQFSYLQRIGGEELMSLYSKANCYTRHWRCRLLQVVAQQ